jgi:predicted RNase H-like HicB family nuclease
MGLREQIKKAGSVAEINDLISKSKTFEYASDRTKSAWKSTAKFRIAELSNPIPSQTAPDLSVKKTKTKKN